MKRTLIITEANEQVASGHLFESLVIYSGLEGAILVVNRDLPTQLVNRLPRNSYFYNTNIQEEIECVFELVERESIEVIVFNLREIHPQFVDKLKMYVDCIIVCIDEFGNRQLDVDVIINPMIGERYWNYYNSKAKIYAGNQYLVLSRSLGKYNIFKKRINRNIDNITISMGGVDINNSTQKILNWLGECNFRGRVNVVLGAGYEFREEIVACASHLSNCRIVQNIGYLYELFFNSDLAFCAGGNTLHELSVIGTPTIVIPTMPHELENALEFHKRGFCVPCKMSESVGSEDIDWAFSNIASESTRIAMMNAGKEIADGKGYVRIERILKTL